jgi:hypothetical protein
VDLAVIALLSGVSGAWLLAGLALVVLQLRSRRNLATPKRMVVGWLLAGLLALLALQELRSQWDEWRNPEKAAAAALAEAEEDEPARSAAPAASASQVQASPDAPADAASASAAAAAAASAATAAELKQAQARIATLEAELASARKPLSLRKHLSRLLDDIGAGLGWGIVYFSLLPAWWNGQTLGKKLLRLRVIELTGQPLTVMRSLRRYGGYAAGMATGGIGFAQALWDVNRQAIQDRVAHTVVVDLRAGTAGPPPPPTRPEPAPDQKP